MHENYHTHTTRCHHAKGSEREYIENAIAAGFDKLGFSDHCPYPFPNGYCSSFRMATKDAEGYVNTLLKLREEYKDRIKIYIGFETEYYPKYFESFLAFIGQFPIDYLILGQHFTNNEIDRRAAYMCLPFFSELKLANYTKQVIAAIKSGKFSYVAHPDVPYYLGPKLIYTRYAEKLCLAAKEADIPLEINFLGIRKNRRYPKEIFWKIAGEVGNKVVFGCDAHRTAEVGTEGAIEYATELVEKYHLNLITEVPLIKP